MRINEHPRYRAAIRAWGRRDYDSARAEFAAYLAALGPTAADFDISFVLESFAHMEATAKERDRFENLYTQVFALHPFAPLPRLHYASYLLTEFHDASAAEAAIVALEALLCSGQWTETETDLSRRAYDAKIATLRAWLRGETGGTVWP